MDIHVFYTTKKNDMFLRCLKQYNITRRHYTLYVHLLIVIRNVVVTTKELVH